MTAPVVRRLRLPAAQSSPAAARAVVSEAVHEVGLTSVLDEAMLLTTELVTNGVVHARTELEIDLVATRDAISVMVLDHHCGPLSLAGWDAQQPGTGAGGTPAQLRERGRGLLLVDRLADRWGTLHHSGGKGVWFRLARPDSDAPTQGMTPSRAPGPAPGVSAAPGAVGGTPGLAAAPDLAVPATAAQAALLVENRRLRRVDIERRAWLTFLAEAGELLAQSLDVELTLALIPRLIVPRLGRWCTVHTAGPSGDLQLAAATHTEEDQLSGLLTQFETTAEVLRDALRTESAVALAAPADGYAVPLIARSQLLGCLTVGRGTATWPHTDEVAIIEDVARRAALAIDNARIHADLKDVASQLQRSLLPPPLPKVTGIEFGAEYLPAGKGVDVGGDFYDVIELAQDRWLVMVGDVSGKGVPVATITGLVRDVTRVLVRDGRSLPEVLSRLNETLVDRGAGRFCTVAFAEVTRPQSGVLAIRLYLAGHHQPVHVQVDGQATLVGECGTALGLLETVRSPESRITLGPGETLVLYTDGVTECRRGEELFGQERLRDHAAALAGFPAEVVAARLLTAALGFSRESPLDDIALLVIRNDSSHLP